MTESGSTDTITTEGDVAQAKETEVESVEGSVRSGTNEGEVEVKTTPGQSVTEKQAEEKEIKRLKAKQAARQKDLEKVEQENEILLDILEVQRKLKFLREDIKDQNSQATDEQLAKTDQLNKMVSGLKTKFMGMGNTLEQFGSKLKNAKKWESGRVNLEYDPELDPKVNPLAAFLYDSTTPKKVSVTAKTDEVTQSKIQITPSTETEITPSVNTEITTSTETDPDNKIKGKFKPKKSKGLLQDTPNVMHVLEPEILKDSGIFDEKNPMNKEAIAAINSIRDFGIQFTKFFNKEFLSKKGDTINTAGIVRLAVSQISNTLNKTVTKAEGTAAKALLTARIHNTFDPTKEYSLSDVLNAVNTNPKLDVQAIPAFKKVIEKKISNEVHREYDPIQYLTDEKGIPYDNVVNAIMAATYKWLAGRSQDASFNDSDSIRTILSLGEEDTISKLGITLISEIGMFGTMLQESLGTEIFQLLGIKSTNDAEFDIQNKLELSLGTQAIATMQSMGLIKQTTVIRGAVPGKEKYATTGFHGLINSQEDSDNPIYAKLENIFFAPMKERKTATGIELVPDTEARKDQGVVEFYKMNTDKKSSLYERVIEPYGLSKNTWERLFKGENSKTNYSFEEPAPHEKMKLKKTDFDATKEQVDNLNKHVVPRKASIRTMGFWLLLGKKNLARIQGKIDPTTAHSENYLTVKGINDGIDLSNQRTMEWIKDAFNQDKGLDSTFYIPEEIWKNGRMGEVGDINQQGDKNHRSLFNIAAWEHDVDLTDTTQLTQFMEAIAFGLDIEQSKVGGISEAIRATNKLLETPIMVKAIEAIQEIFDGQGTMDKLDLDTFESTKDLYTDQMTAIADAVEEAGTNMRAMKALIEYTRYKHAVLNGETSFRTDISTEVDGVANGPFIARIQLMLNKAWPKAAEWLAALQNSGVAFSGMQPTLAAHLARKLSLDAYNATGSAWSDAIEKITLTIQQRKAKAPTLRDKNDIQRELNVLTGMRGIFGEFRDKDTGHLNDVVRKLSKKPTMQTIFGMQPKTLKTNLESSFIESIYTKMEKIVAKDSVADLKTLNKNLRLITGRDVFSDTTIINREVVLTTVLNKQDISLIKESIQAHHGVALQEAILQTYGDLQAAFKPLNDGVGLSAILYNTILKIKVNKAKGDAEWLNRKFTVGKLKEIEKSIESMYPYTKTAIGGKIPLAKKSRAKDYSDAERITQYYKHLHSKKAIPFKISGVEAPGVAPVILSIHNSDSVFQNRNMGKFPMVNNHDGSTIGIDQAKQMAEFLNNVTYNTLNDFDMATEMHTAAADVFTQFDEQIKGTNSNEVAAMLVEEFKSMGTYKYKSPTGDLSLDVNQENITAIMNAIMSDMEQVAVETTANKKTLMGAMDSLEQYSYESGNYDTEIELTPLTFGEETFNPITITEEAEAILKGAMENTNEVVKAIGELQTQTTITDPTNTHIQEAVDYIVTEQILKENISIKESLPQDKWKLNKTVDLLSKKKQTFETNAGRDVTITELGTVLQVDTHPGLYFMAHKAKSEWKLTELSTGFGFPIRRNSKKKLVEELITNETFSLEAVKAGIKHILGSTQSSTSMSIDPNDYTSQAQVSSMNVSNVYESIKDDSTVTDSATHDKHLKGIIQDVIQPVMGSVDLFLKDNPDIEPEGVVVFNETGEDNDKIFISSQNVITGPVSGALMQGIRMSTGEVYTHELLHPILRAGLKLNKRARTKVDTLFDLAKKSLGKDGYKAFLNDPNMDITDPANQYEVQAAIERYDYVFQNADTVELPADKNKQVQETSNYLDEFLALGMTNENFMRALTRLKVDRSVYGKSTWADIKGNNIQEMLGNIGQSIMDFMYKRFTSNVTGDDVAEELRNLAVILSKKDSDKKSLIYLGLQQFGKYSTKATTYGNDFIKKSLNSWPIVKGSNELKKMLVKAKKSNTILGQRLRETEYAYQSLDQGLVKSMISEMGGRTDRVAWLHELLSKRQIFLDHAKQIESDTYINMATKPFKKISDVEKTSITKVGLKADLSVIFNSLGSDGLNRVLKSKKELGIQIQAVLDKVALNPSLAPHSTYYQRASDALGYFMIHGQERTDETAFQSTRVIAALKNRTGVIKQLTKEEINEAEELVEQLSSLYALRHTAKDQRALFTTLMEREPEGINSMFRMHEVLKDRALEDSFGGNKYKFIKGYTKQILNSRISLKYGTANEEKAFARKGYKKVSLLQKDMLDTTEDIYMYESRTQKPNDLLSTILSYTSNKKKGTSSEEITRNMGLGTALGRTNNKNLIRSKQSIIDRMADPSITPKLEQSNSMVPQVDDSGKITQYRYMMSEQTKDSHMEQVTEFDKILGSMAGQLVDKVRSPVINQELIEGLHAEYLDGYTNNPSGFVEIGPSSEDPKLREIYQMIPAKTKKDIQSIWNNDTMYVPKDMVDISFGYRNYSITDAFAKEPEDRARLEKIIVGVSELFLKDKAVHLAGNLETAAMELTKIAKSNIIIKALHCTLGNLGSNLVYLRSRGVPISTILKLGWEAIAMGNKYQVDNKKLNELNLQRQIYAKSGYTANQLKNIDSKIARVKDAITRNPTTITIQAGLMPTFVDDIETVTSGTNFPTDFEKKVTKYTDKLPDIVRNVGKVVMLTEDTNSFKVLNNAVKMTDFIGRHVLYNHYTKAGMEHKKAIASVEDEFVNFNVPTHRMVEYGNKIGLLWFTKYGTRILKVIKDSAVDKPFDVLMALVLSAETGLDNIGNSIPGFTKSPFSFLDDPVSAFTGSLN